jgi:hypothetical protein
MNRQIHKLTLSTMLLTQLAAAAAGNAISDVTPAEEWFDDTTPVPQAREGELLFLSEPPENAIPHSRNTLTIAESSLEDGWVGVEQCYEGLDAVPEAEIVYRYKSMRKLRVHSSFNIGQAFIREQSIQLIDVQNRATLCMRAEIQVLHPQADGNYVLYNGPFHRKFLDGYFPLHVTLDIRYPPGSMRYAFTHPTTQPGFKVSAHDGTLHIDTWFAGMLNIEVHFSPADTRKR